MAQKTPIVYEFRQISTDQTLVLDKPAQVTFQIFGTGSIITINNSYKIQSFKDSQSAAGVYNWQLVLNNNVNEVDVTNYVIRFGGGVSGLLFIIIKYYENPKD